ncbi:hypothetical protein F3J20_11940 [Paraburkholderia sp. Cy-641]|uniref:hypothetical protein n=1 Tax=Paraburkholderia sp. Cy-641 TaxID=2608337 RepID=UPI0014218CBF|nr:hypothetical protein [Paraburkholderia sp. Cy-641]NIF78099.1 hypothetical protein [Paraburkholderia sp. Cy-641]
MKHPVQPRDPSSDRRDEIKQELAGYGYRIEYDAGAIPGEAHNLISLDTGEAVDDVPEPIAQLAAEWSQLTDDLENP